MIAYREALEVLRRVGNGRRVPSTLLAPEQAMGAVLRRSLASPEQLPSFDNSAMDGFALHADATRTATALAPVRLRVEGFVAAGDVGGAIGSGAEGAVEIMTGAPIPPGHFDAVVRMEDVEICRDSAGRASQISLRAPVAVGDNLRLAGEDITAGQALLRAGERLRPEHLLVLAAVGVREVEVSRPPSVAVIATGKELVDPGTARLAPGMIRSSTASFLQAALTLCGAAPRFHGIVRDDPDHFSELLDRVEADSPDLVLTTGAVSVGKHDFVERALVRRGITPLFHKVAIRPGKPLLFAERPAGSLFLGLPGNPVATAVGFRFFVEPLLRCLMGEPPERPLLARLGETSSKPEGLRAFYKARVRVDSGQLGLQLLPGQASFRVRPLLDANCWAVLPEVSSQIEAGSWVETYPLLPGARGGWQPAADEQEGT